MRDRAVALGPTTERTAGWGSAYTALVEPAQVTQPCEKKLSGELIAHDLGPTRLIRIRTDEATIKRSPGDIGYLRERTFTLVLQVKGKGLVEHYGHAIELHEGDFTLYDNSAPFTCRLDDASELIMLRAPARMMKERLPSPNLLCGKRLPAGEGLAYTAAAMIVSLFHQMEDGLEDECRERAANHLLAVVASCYVAAFDQMVVPSSVVSGRHWKVKLFIEQHLRDPDLSPSLIAERLRISSRYLRMIFATSNETPSAYILRRRLEECASRIGDARWRGHSITEIAFSWGFNSAPHFTRSFRDRFHISPRDYRQQHLDRRQADAAERTPCWDGLATAGAA